MKPLAPPETSSPPRRPPAGLPAPSAEATSPAPWHPELLLVGGFLAAALLGALLLWVPACHRGQLDFLDALFTATSAVCVTGLVVVDTGAEFTFLGQLTIVLLIQIGGLGVMAFAALAARSLGRRLGLRAQAALTDSMIQRDLAHEFADLFGRILRVVFVIEAVGALVLFLGLLPHESPLDAAWSAIFHAVSAFCNAGFSLYADSLTQLRGSAAIIGTVTLLILLGGLGHPVLVELLGTLGRRDPDAPTTPGLLSLHSRVVIATSAALVGVGTVGLFFLGSGATGSVGGWGAAIFQSVSARTAGFNSVPIDALPTPSLLLLVALMFVGGSPGSCAGGVKTTSLVVWLASLRAQLRGEAEVRILDRSLSEEVVRKVWTILGLSVAWNALGLLVLSLTEASSSLQLEALLFEQVSAFGTVGLSTGVTPHLTAAGKLWIITTMFLGRVGPLTLAITLVTRPTARFRHPEGRLMIG